MMKKRVKIGQGEIKVKAPQLQLERHRLADLNVPISTTREFSNAVQKI